MEQTPRYTFRKDERICSKLQIERLFGGGKSKSVSAFPLRAVYLYEDSGSDETTTPVSILVSVPKKRFKHAVQRNRVKRIVRESYRLNKYSILGKTEGDKKLLIAFIWMDDKLHSYKTVEKKVVHILERIGNSIQAYK